MSTDTLSKKAYCTCKNRPGYSGLAEAGPTRRDGGIQFVCGNCLKPMFEVWSLWIERCEDCFNTFSSPWEESCKDCHITMNGSGEQSYRGWRWARLLQLAWRSSLGLTTPSPSELQLASQDSYGPLGEGPKISLDF